MPEHLFFNGVRYNRYPESENPTHRKYFSRGGGKGFLHRDVWEFHNGPIPENHHVHHIDGNHNNNDISNLCCVLDLDHWKLHEDQRRAHGLSNDNLVHLEKAREKAKKWHTSPEGLKWHRSVSGQFLVQAREKLALKRIEQASNPVACKCEECGQMFPSPTGRAKVCSNACHSKRSRRRRRNTHAGSSAERRSPITATRSPGQSTSRSRLPQPSPGASGPRGPHPPRSRH